MKKVILPMLLIGIVTTSCVSKKKYAALEHQYNDTRGNLQKTTLEKEKLEAKFAKIEKRVEDYNQKINSLRNVNSDLKQENDIKLDMVGNTALISNSMKKKMRETLANVNLMELVNVKIIKDSMNVAVAYNLKKNYIYI